MKDIEIYIENGTVETKSVAFVNVYKVIINKLDVSIDCYNRYDYLIGVIYYEKDKNTDIWVEDYANNQTITLARNGKIIYGGE